MTTQIALERPGSLRGLRMNADEYLALGESQERYELIDRVVCMSPGPSSLHQRIITEVAIQIGAFLKTHPVGEVAVEVDVRFSDTLVYRPDVVFLSAVKADRCRDRVTEVPDVVIEVVSPDSNRLDVETKMRDYERFGVGEYWLIDPLRGTTRFFRRQGDRFVSVTPSADTFVSLVISSFGLDLVRLNDMFE